MTSLRPETPVERDMMARLLALADVRAAVPDDRARRVKQAVLAEVREVARHRRIRRRVYAGIAALGAAAVVVVTVRFQSPADQPPAAVQQLGTIDRLEGSVWRVAPGRAGGPATLLTPVDVVSAGDSFETSGGGRLSVRLSEGASLRFDRGSRARLISSRRVQLDTGAMYFDHDRELEVLEVHTPHGIVKDIGTQFEVRLTTESLRVRVRSGVVEVRMKGEMVAAHAGTELTIGPTGRSTRSVLPYGSEWEWAAGLAAGYDTNGQRLTRFLEYLSREHGWTLSYESQTLERQAEAIVLHGSLGQLRATDALDAAVSASGLTYHLDRGRLVVGN
jgi:ferric-dicitrate binding protein FerR (iron transport regulator)